MSPIADPSSTLSNTYHHLSLHTGISYKHASEYSSFDPFDVFWAESLNIFSNDVHNRTTCILGNDGDDTLNYWLGKLLTKLRKDCQLICQMQRRMANLYKVEKGKVIFTFMITYVISEVIISV